MNEPTGAPDPRRCGSQAPRVPRLALVTTLLLGACAPGGAEDRFTAVADVQELMFHVVEPAAQVYWKSVGWVIDSQGEQYIHPTTDDEWIAVENAAFMVAESGNLLMMADRALDDGGWVAMSQSLTEVGQRALQAAEDRDEQRVFDLGAEMYFVCSNCHAAYSPEVLRPSDDRSVAEDEAETEGGA